MFSLSPRWKPIRTTTSRLLGPNHYYFDDKQILKNAIPFLSTTELSSGAPGKIYTDAIYNLQIKKSTIGGSSLRNKSTRLTICPSTTPGPGIYNPKLPKKTVQKPVDPSVFKGRHLYVCRVPYSSESRGPSIPTRIDENGYSYKNDRLVKNPPCDHDMSLGPAFYDVISESCTTSSGYKGRCWSRSKTERLKYKETGTPAPCTYDTSMKKTLNTRDELVREMARATAVVPRFLDALATKIRYDNFPGPSSYNIQTKNHCHQKSLSRNPAPFNTRARRFQETNSSESPGANSYNVSNEAIKSGSSMKASPFNVDSDRFPAQKKLVTPGPSDYNVHGPLEEKLWRKLRARNNFMPPFNHSAKRETTFISKEAELLPCPFDYTLEAPLVTASVTASIFKSRTDRFPEINTLESPAYDVSEQFNKIRNSTSHNKSKVPFETKRISRGTIFQPTSFYTPCPSSYAVHKYDVLFKGGKIGRSVRFKEQNDEFPGPADYDINSGVNSSISKAIVSHNLKVRESVAQKYKKSPKVKKDTRRKKRKTLRAFHRHSDTSFVNWLDLLNI